VEEAGALHRLVCNGGRTKHKDALDFTTEEINQMQGIDVGGSIWRLLKGSENANDVVVWFVFLGSGRCQSVHQAGRERLWHRIVLVRFVS